MKKYKPRYLCTDTQNKNLLNVSCTGLQTLLQKFYVVLSKTTISTRPSFIGFQCVTDFFLPRYADARNPFSYFIRYIVLNSYEYLHIKIFA